MSDLVEFLTARLDEEELLAHRAAAFRDAFDDEDSDNGVDWISDNTMVYTTGQVFLVNAIPPEKFGRPHPEEMLQHIARWDPARVLAEVEAKRKIIEEHLPVSAFGFADCRSCRDLLGPGQMAASANSWPCRTVTLLAQPYADHPDFDPAWRT